MVKATTADLKLISKYFGGAYAKAVAASVASATKQGFTTNGVKTLLSRSEHSCPKIEVDEAIKLVANPKVVFVDVRGSQEVAVTGKIPGAVTLPREELEKATSKFVDASKKYVVYCDTGRKSRMAGLTLKSLGYPDVVTIGSFSDWVAAKAPVDLVSQTRSARTPYMPHIHAGASKHSLYPASARAVS